MSQQHFIAEKTIAWTAKSGHEIEVSVRLVNGNDGSKIEHHLRINGGEWTQDSLLPTRLYPGLVAKIGNVGLTAEKYDELRAARRELEGHPEWVDSAYVQAARRDKSEWMLTLGGRTY